MSIFRKAPKARPASPPRASRSWSWRVVRAAQLHHHPACAACGSRLLVTAHHVVPVHVDPLRELDPSNLITLCEGYEFGVNCHLYHGHGGRWHHWNPSVREQAASALRWLTMHVVH